MKRIALILLVFSFCFFLLLNPVFAASPFEDVQPIIDEPDEVMGLIFENAILFGFLCLVEWLVSIPFKMHEEYKYVIILTNICTQIILHTLEFLFFGLYTDVLIYLMLILFPLGIALEIVVYVIEFFIYYKKMLGFSTLQIFLYTVCANAASLFLGLLILT